jgi:hypothetical protein
MIKNDHIVFDNYFITTQYWKLSAADVGFNIYCYLYINVLCTDFIETDTDAKLNTQSLLIAGLSAKF